MSDYAVIPGSRAPPYVAYGKSPLRPPAVHQPGMAFGHVRWEEPSSAGGSKNRAVIFR
jgi:hypothetical protein